MTSFARPVSRWLWSVCLLAAAATAQCFPWWVPGNGTPGTDQTVRALATWDPDGSGPASPLVVMGGDFTYAGQASSYFVAGYIAANGLWVNVGGLGGFVSALVSTPAGELIAAGAFADSVARFDGFGWTPLGFGLDAPVYALAALPNGDLIAAGEFAIAYGFGPAAHIARWDGVSWQPLGAGTDARVRALAVLPNSDVVAAGDFTQAGGVPCDRIARWNGSTWSPLGAGVGGTFAVVHALAVLPNGDVVAGGAFSLAGGNAANRIARWSGGAWSSFGSGADGAVFALHVTANGDLIAAGGFQQVDGVAAARIARFDGTSWMPFGAGFDLPALAVTSLPGGEVFAGGQFVTAGGATAKRVARWNGVAWAALGTGTDDAVAVLRTLANGDLVAGGGFTLIDGVAARRVARRTGGVWTPLGSPAANGVAGGISLASVRAIAELPNGDLVVGGSFTSAGGVAANNIARWDGATWSPLGSGVDIGVASLLLLADGSLLAGGPFTTAGGGAASHIARWDGSAWSPLGTGITGPWFPSVDELVQLPNGDVIAGGVFTGAGGVATENLARWDGAAWHAFGTPMSASSRVGAMTVAPNGDLLVGGTFTSIGGVAANFTARWDGAAWSPLGNFAAAIGASVWSLLVLPDGDVFAGGSQLPAFGLRAGLVRWDGTNWLPPWSPAGGVGALAMTADGDVAVGGAFFLPSDHAVDFALLRTPCLATALPFGSGCSGSGGANALRADTRPWTGATFHATASGLAPNSLALAARGLGTLALPLPTIVPQGLPGCSLLVTPELLDLYVPSGASIDVSFPVPDLMALAGAMLHLQVVPVAFAANGAIAEFSSSNALTLTIGTW